MENKRREFIKSASLMAASPLLIGTIDNEKKSSKVIHHVFFWLKNKGSEADKKQLIEGLKTLKAIKEIKKLQIGTPASTIKRDVVDNSFDVSELMYFDSAATQDAYQIHPIHQAFVKNYSHLWEKVVVYDMVLV